MGSVTQCTSGGGSGTLEDALLMAVTVVFVNLAKHCEDDGHPSWKDTFRQTFDDRHHVCSLNY